MEFAIGFIAGILFCLFVAVLLYLFRRPIEHKLNIVSKQLDNVGPRPQGMIYIPPDEDEEARAAKIAENQSQGRSTKLSDL